MPTIEFMLNDMQMLLDKEIKLQDLEDKMLFAKCEVEHHKQGLVRVDVKDTNRPDLWSVEGIARQLRGEYGIEEGLPKFKVEKSNVKMMVDRKVENVRPKTVGAVIKNVKLSDEAIKQAIQLQEKIHLTYGRKREQVAIGVYDFDKIVPPITYTTVEPDGIKFVPLDFEEELTPREILKKHPKGREYSHLIDKFGEYPLMIDSEGNVLSMPPIINSAHTGKVTPDTKNVFIELTGLDMKRLLLALNVLVTALYERGGKIQSIEVIYPKEKISTPDLNPREYFLDPKECAKILGIDFTEEEIIKLLRKARYDAEILGGGIKVKYPAYRDDIMHQRDIIEDIAISYDVNKIKPEIPELVTVGKENEIEEFCELVRDAMIGLGFQEILTFSLTNKVFLFEKMNMKEEKICEIANPVSANWTVLRNWLLPSAMEFLSKNIHVEYPHKIFEVGDVVIVDETQESRTKTLKKVACAIADKKSSYEDISSVADAFLSYFGARHRYVKTSHKSFIPGRVAKVLACERAIGIIGEIHPYVLNNWGIEKPVSAFELDVGMLFDIKCALK